VSDTALSAASMRAWIYIEITEGGYYVFYIYKTFRNREKTSKLNSPASPRRKKYTGPYREIAEKTPDENP
jgi:hypothetical protein